MNLLEELKNDVAGIATLREWLGDGGIPVERNKAEMRAAICINCKEHRAFKWWETAKDFIAETIKRHLELKNRLNIFTSVDDKLFMCRACGCCANTKVQVPLKHILANITQEAYQKLAPDCWIRTEQKP